MGIRIMLGVLMLLVLYWDVFSLLKKQKLNRGIKFSSHLLGAYYIIKL